MKSGNAIWEAIRALDGEPGADTGTCASYEQTKDRGARQQ